MATKSLETLFFSDRIIVVTGEISKTELPQALESAPLVRTLRLGPDKDFPLAALVISRHVEKVKEVTFVRYNLMVKPNKDAPKPEFPINYDAVEGVLLARDIPPVCKYEFTINDKPYSVTSTETKPLEFKVAPTYINTTS